jgi:hypothetical protein
MREATQQPFPLTAPAAALIETTARWLDIDEDVAFGCECADPGLQIERWRQEAVPLKSTSS